MGATERGSMTSGMMDPCHAGPSLAPCPPWPRYCLGSSMRVSGTKAGGDIYPKAKNMPEKMINL